MNSKIDPLKTRNPIQVPVDQQTRTGTWTQQWLLDKAQSLPKREGCAIQTFIAGEAGFRQIAADIEAATESINLVCWGFDPGMALNRDKAMPRFPWTHGEPYGELLKRKAAQGVKVRLLVWYHPQGSAKQNSLMGYVNPSLLEVPLGGVINRTWDEMYAISRSLNAVGSLGASAVLERTPPLKPSWAQRLDYCTQWWREATSGQIANLEVRCRDGVKDKVKLSLTSEEDAPYASLPKTGATDMLAEKKLLEDYATHHQKPIVIDYGKPGAQVGYVMGLNSVSDYWDNEKHEINGAKRELHLQGKNDEAADAALKKGQPISRKPLQDYACRVQGPVLQDVWRNFYTAWNRAQLLPKLSAASNARHQAVRSADLGALSAPAPLRAMGGALSGGAFAAQLQIARTQPEEQHQSTDQTTPTDKSIKQIYWQACESARNYIYIENQYFFYEAWARHLKARRQAFMAHLQKVGQSSQQAKMLHLMAVIPLPEDDGMVPRTYDTLKSLGQADSMPEQRKRYAEQEKAWQKSQQPHRPLGNSMDHVDPKTLLPYADGQARPQIPKEPQRLASEVVANDAARIQAPELKEVQVQDENNQSYKTSVLHQDGKSLGLKVLICKMVAPNKDGPAALGVARDIYIHSKLLLVDDCLMSLGSANLNQRSMAADSEINVCTDSIPHNRDLRQRVWGMQTDGKLDGGAGTPTQRQMTKLFDDWGKLAQDNARFIGRKDPAKIQGHIVAFQDDRSVSHRVG